MTSHLELARKYSKLERSKWFYFIHMWWALKFSATLFVWSILMLIHAVFPQLVGFTVLENLVKFLRNMKDQHPDDPILKDLNL
jgi:hypothetical protein